MLEISRDREELLEIYAGIVSVAVERQNINDQGGTEWKPIV
jgi:hypothetical protein